MLVCIESVLVSECVGEYRVCQKKGALVCVESVLCESVFVSTETSSAVPPS